MFAVVTLLQNEVQEELKGVECIFRRAVQENECAPLVLRRLTAWFSDGGRGGGRQISRFICQINESPLEDRPTGRTVDSK